MIDHDYFKSGTPCLGFVAKSGTGKTTLLEKVISQLHSQGIRIAIIKHSHHDFEIDLPGKDSYRLRHAGAQQTLITSPYRWALINENLACKDQNDTLKDAVQRLNHHSLDCVLIEGFKGIEYPKIELHRSELGQACLFSTDTSIIAVATNDESLADCTLPILDINDSNAICQFLTDTFSLKGQP